jgi:hypothetical protein
MVGDPSEICREGADLATGPRASSNARQGPVLTQVLVQRTGSAHPEQGQGRTWQCKSAGAPLLQARGYSGAARKLPRCNWPHMA